MDVVTVPNYKQMDFQSVIPIVDSPLNDISYEPPISVQTLLGEYSRQLANGDEYIIHRPDSIMDAIRNDGPTEDEWARMTLFLPAQYGAESFPGIDAFSPYSEWPHINKFADDGIRSFTFDYHVDEITYRDDGSWIFKPTQTARLFHCDGIFMYAIVQVAVYPHGYKKYTMPHMNANIFCIPLSNTSIYDTRIIVRDLNTPRGRPLGITHIFQPYAPREHSIGVLKSHGFTDQQIFHLDMIVFLHRISRHEGYMPRSAVQFIQSLLKVLKDGEYQITVKGKPRKVHWGIIEFVFCEACDVPSLANESVIFIHFAEMYKSSPDKCSRDKFIRVREQTYQHCLRVRW